MDQLFGRTLWNKLRTIQRPVSEGAPYQYPIPFARQVTVFQIVDRQEKFQAGRIALQL